jgi:2-polyprenyl-3-methyl-5-hydroxy-6-metoxy-1,4-benzoquinol methylase
VPLPESIPKGALADAETHCTICGSRDSRVVLHGCGDQLAGVPGDWEIRQCRLCSARFTSPRRAEGELLQYYPSHYHVFQPVTPARNGILGMAIRRCAMLPYTLRFGDPDWSTEPFGSRRMLDVGCGTGHILKRLSARGWETFGIDLSPIAVASARRAVPSARIETATLATFHPDHKFALISMQHVLEHLPDPVDALRRCHELLEPGGRLWVGVPNVDSFEARLFGRRWVGLDIPRHLTHFSQSTLVQLLDRCGFKTIRIRPAMFASFVSESLALALPTTVGRRLLGSIAGRMLYFASVFPASVSYLLGNRPVLEILCQRR